MRECTGNERSVDSWTCNVDKMLLSCTTKKDAVPAVAAQWSYTSKLSHAFLLQCAPLYHAVQVHTPRQDYILWSVLTISHEQDSSCSLPKTDCTQRMPRQNKLTA
eukprot:scaffold2858_cov659-Pavlova_lutheri.AAC.83